MDVGAKVPQRRLRAINTMVESRAMELAPVTLPSFTYNGGEFPSVQTEMPFRAKGAIQLELKDIVWQWFWVRVKSCDLPDCKRSVPGGALHEGKENVYWHKQKNAWIAKRPAENSPNGKLEWKQFKPNNEGGEVATTLEEACGWHAEA